jgi:uncharacterized protein (DUF1501 family)
MFARRAFMKSSAMAMFGVGAAPSWLARAAFADTSSAPRKKILVAIFQRGAADGLNVVVPFGEARYYGLRPSLAIAKPTTIGPNAADSAIDLNGFFGLHPSLAPLKPIYDAKALAIVHAAGSPDPTRSHFDAQDFMEAGTPGLKATTGGWLNRALAPAQAPVPPLRAIALGPSLPRTLRGTNPAVAVNNIIDFQVRDAASSQMFQSMYEHSVDTVLNGAGRDTFEAVKILQAIQKQNYTPAGGASYPGGRFGQSMRQIAQLIKANVGVEVAFADIGGWDTHFNQMAGRASQGPLANQLRELGQSLAAFYQDLGDHMSDVAVVTMSEFGRTAKENGSRGTDHGHANVMFVMGGGINGGIRGEWPGLEQEQLYESRDLNVTTDFRDVLSELVSNHLGNRQLSAVFPGYQVDAKKYRGVVAA